MEASNGVKHYTRQCRSCWHYEKRWLKKTEQDPAALERAPKVRKFEWSDRQALKMAMLTPVQHLQQKQREAEREEWLEGEYREYLTSADWEDKRKKVLKRAVHTCEACLDARATQVHHLSGYEDLENVPLWNLKAVCKSCHDRIHGRTDG